MKESIRVLGLSLTLAMSLGLVSCSDDDNGTIVVPGPTPPPTDPEFLVRAVHASPDAPEVDVFANDILAFPSLTFFEIAPDALGSYVSFPAGTVNVDVALAEGGAVVLSDSIFAPEGSNQTVVVTGLVNSPSPELGLQVISFTDDVTPTPGQAELRILHLSPGAPNVDVRLGNNDPTGQPLVLNLPFGSSSDDGGDRIIVPPGVYTVTVFAAGTETRVFTETFELTADNNFSVYAVGQVDDASFRLEASIDH